MLWHLIRQCYLVYYTTIMNKSVQFTPLSISLISSPMGKGGNPMWSSAGYRVEQRLITPGNRNVLTRGLAHLMLLWA